MGHNKPTKKSAVKCMSVCLPGYCHNVGVAMVELCDPPTDHPANPAVRSSVQCNTAPPPATPPVVLAAMPGVESDTQDFDINT